GELIIHYSPVVDLQDGVAVVDLPEDITVDPKPLWSSYIVGYFIGDAPPHIGKVHATVNRLWYLKEKPAKIYAQFIAPKTIVFRIEDQNMKARVLRRHFWHIADIPLVVQEWTPDTEASKPDLTAIPLWVDLKGVPGHLFYHKDVAHILVVLHLENPLPERISIKGTDHTIQVSYPWLPPRCLICHQWGHAEKECGKKEASNNKTTHMVKNGKQKKDKSVVTEEAQPESVGNDAPHDEHDTALNKDDPKPAVENSEMVPGANEWQDVEKAHSASPRRETQKTALNDIEEGKLESSSSDEDDEPESSDPPQKEIKTIPQKADKAKTSSRNKAGTNPQVQNDKKKSAKPTKNNNAPNRRH
ncbi:unnamed protein product, partial [Brassica oleracea var. botrytis]